MYVTPTSPSFTSGGKIRILRYNPTNKHRDFLFNEVQKILANQQLQTLYKTREIEINFSDNKLQKETIKLIKQQLKEVGIKYKWIA